MERDIRLFEALRSRFTRQPKWQALVDWQTYYEPFLQSRPGDTSISHSGPLVGDEARQAEVQDLDQAVLDDHDVLGL